MKKVLLVSFGSRGDVQPYIALGKALAARGAAVTVSTSKTFNDAITNHGLTVCRDPWGWSETDKNETVVGD